MIHADMVDHSLYTLTMHPTVHMVDVASTQCPVRDYCQYVAVRCPYNDRYHHVIISVNYIHLSCLEKYSKDIQAFELCQ